MKASTIRPESFGAIRRLLVNCPGVLLAYGGHSDLPSDSLNTPLGAYNKRGPLCRPLNELNSKLLVSPFITPGKTTLYNPLYNPV